jgi:hypothetical protein
VIGGGGGGGGGLGTEVVNKEFFFNVNFIVLHVLYNPKLVPSTGTLQFSVICLRIYRDFLYTDRRHGSIRVPDHAFLA